jgi:hypothetical protein
MHEFMAIVQEYPATVAEEGCVGLEQLQQVMEWKLTRGKFRPLMGQIKKNANEAVLGTLCNVCKVCEI